MFIFIPTPCRLREKWQSMFKRSAAICSRSLATRCTRPKERGRYMSGKEPAWSRCFMAGGTSGRAAAGGRRGPGMVGWREGRGEGGEDCEVLATTTRRGWAILDNE